MRHAPRFGIAFDGENHALQIRHNVSAEGLHGVKRARGGAAACERGENGAVERGAGVQDDFAAAFGAADFCESARDGGQIVVGGREKDYIGIEN